MIIRDEKQADSAAIHELVAEAFRRPDEAVLIDRLRSDGECGISLVAVEDDEIIGHVLFSRMTAPFRALGLGPVSVKPSRQHCGIGSVLIRTGLGRAREAAWEGVFVLGETHFYTRFGFNLALANGFMSRYSGPHLMAVGRTVALAAGRANSAEYEARVLSRSPSSPTSALPTSIRPPRSPGRTPTLQSARWCACRRMFFRLLS